MDYPRRDVPNACNAPGDADGIRQIKHHYYVIIGRTEFNIPWGQKLGYEIQRCAKCAINMCILLNCSGAAGLHYWGPDHHEQQEQDPNFDEKVQKYCSLVEYFGIKINPKEKRIEELIHPYLLGYYFSDKKTRSNLSILSGLPLDLWFPRFEYDGRNIEEIIEKGEARKHIQAAKSAGFYYHSVEELENEPEEVFLAKKQKLIDYYSNQDTTMAQPNLSSANVLSNHSSTQDTTIKQPVVFSTFCVITTIMCLIILAWCTFIIPESWWQIGWGAFISILLIICLYYMPISISADKNAIYIIRSLMKIKTIPLSEVASIQLCPPTMGAIRICGSGGFFGHWGWFKERDLGKYFAYYGKSSDCFLVKLHDGRKYILGCKNAPKIVEYISNHIK